MTEKFEEHDKDEEMDDEDESEEDESEDEDEEDFDLIEISMNEDDIDEVMAKLVELKESKKKVQFPIASDLDLLVHYDFDIDEEGE